MKDKFNNCGLVTSVAAATLLGLGLVSTQNNLVKADSQTEPNDIVTKNENIEKNKQKEPVEENGQVNSLKKDINDNTHTENIQSNSKLEQNEPKEIVNNKQSAIQVKSTDSTINSKENNNSSQLIVTRAKENSASVTADQLQSKKDMDPMHEGMDIKNGYIDKGYTYVDPTKTSPERKPSYHMVTDQGWSNDLQTILYDPTTKEYHLYFLHSKDGATNPFGPSGQNWNESISKDLIHFSNQQIDAIPATDHEYANNPDTWRSAWTGSIIKNNGLIAGVPKGDYVAYFSGLKKKDNSQNIWAAWSDDNGTTFKHVLNEGSPVLDHSWDFASKDKDNERDAGVFYYNNKMIMYAAEGDKFGAYQSIDGIHWTTADPNGASKVGGGSAMPGFTSEDIPLECPAIRFMKNSNGETKVVLFMGGKMPQKMETTGTYYTVGHLDANGLFANETGVQRLDLGSDYYGANFSGSVDSQHPSDSIISMGWVGNWSYTSSGVHASQKYGAASERLGSYSLARKLILNADNTISVEPLVINLEEKNKQKVSKNVDETPIDTDDDYGYHKVAELQQQPANSKYILNFSTSDGSIYSGAIKITFNQGADFNEIIYDPTNGNVRCRGVSSELTDGAADYYKQGLYYGMGYKTQSELENQKNITLTIYTDKDSIELFFPNGKAYTIARFCVNDIQDLSIESQAGNGHEQVNITSSEVGPSLVGYHSENQNSSQPDNPNSPIQPVNPTTPVEPNKPDSSSDLNDLSNVISDVNTTVSKESSEASATSVKDNVSSTDTTNIQPKSQSVVKVVIHNAYVYKKNGQRFDHKVLKSGFKVRTYGKVTIKGIKYYLVKNNKYIKVSDIDGILRKLRHTSFVYDKFGKRIRKLVIRKGKKVRTYGSAVTIGHKKFYIIGLNQFVKKSNF